MFCVLLYNTGQTYVNYNSQSLPYIQIESLRG